MGRTPRNLPAIQDRRAEVVRLRAQGLTWDQVAGRAGYANGSGALKAWRKAIQQTPDLAVKEIRAAERERLSQMDAVLADIVAHPPAKTTAIGKTVIDPDTGETVRDMTAVIAAVRERRQVGESYRRLTAADVPAAAPPLIDARSLTLITEVRTEQHARDCVAPPPPLAPLPPGYDTLPPAEQARLELDRRRAQVAAQQAAIQGEITD